ncbi:MAG: hypothetical protein ACU0DE_01965, partial [Paracoccus sp. (in: a-proteobacteria)]|uniref:hypothetical protein n=1 Tax=Paracoccus sp. TaxID=267 RepID=UPI004057D8B8
MPIGGFSVSHISKNRGYRGASHLRSHHSGASRPGDLPEDIDHYSISGNPGHILAISWPGSSRGFGARRHSGLEKDMPSHLATIAILLAAGIASPSLADGLGRGLDGKLAPGLAMPEMDAAKGRLLFGSKGCVVCHSINGIGGEDARAFGAEYMDDPMNPFD